MQTFTQRKTILVVAVLALAACLAGCGMDNDLDVPYRVGFNKLRTNRTVNKVEDALTSAADLGAKGLRHQGGWGVSWWATYTGGGDYSDPACYDFSLADKVLLNELDLYPTLTLFQNGGASVVHKGAPSADNLYTPDGEILDVTVASVKDKVEDYCTLVATRYGLASRHFEVGNEIYYNYRDNYSVDNYVDLLEVVSTAVKSVNSDNQVIIGGLAHLSHDGPLDWLDDVLKEADKRDVLTGDNACIDVISFHHYGDWSDFKGYIDDVKDVLDKHDVKGKLPLWATELGSPYIDVATTSYTDTEDTQAADIFRKLSIAFGNGVKLANWHTHISSNDDEGGSWAGYGVLHAGTATETKGSHAFKLFTDKLGSFGSCTAVSQGDGNDYIFRFDDVETSTDPLALYTVTQRWVVWDSNTQPTNHADLSGEVSTKNVSATYVVPDSSGTFTTKTFEAGCIEVGTNPVLVEESVVISQDFANWLGTNRPQLTGQVQESVRTKVFSKDLLSQIRTSQVAFDLTQGD